jgi:hypothetical protein
MRVLTDRRVRTLATAGVILAAAAVPAAAVTGGTYRGTTSQHKPVTIKVRGTQIRYLAIGWNATCPSGILGPLKTYHKFVPIDGHGHWKASGAYTAGPFNGLSERFTIRDHGSFAAHGRGRGVFTGLVKVYRDGTPPKYLYSCSSGRITFRFRRAG